MADNNTYVTIEELNPNFLYTWKGTRDREKDEASFHSHDHLEMAFVMSGVGRYRFEDGIVSVQEGDLLIINPGVRHQALACPEADNPATEFFVGASGIRIPGLPDNALPVPGDGHILHTGGELRQKLFKICSSMEAEKAVCRQGRYFMLKAYLMQMILLVVREQCEPEESAQGYAFESVNKKYVVEQMVNYFEDHFSEKISLDQVAENMYLSPFYISKIFKSETGDTPIRHLINIRLEKAKELLESGYKGSIQEVAASVGYDDAYHFSKLFKKHFGISPSQARRKE
ncbi:MAG: AraC family transcriptional regulator [Acetatifactor sp.]